MTFSSRAHSLSLIISECSLMRSWRTLITNIASTVRRIRLLILLYGWALLYVMIVPSSISPPLVVIQTPMSRAFTTSCGTTTSWGRCSWEETRPYLRSSRNTSSKNTPSTADILMPPSSGTRKSIWLRWTRLRSTGHSHPMIWRRVCRGSGGRSSKRRKSQAKTSSKLVRRSRSRVSWQVPSSQKRPPSWDRKWRRGSSAKDSPASSPRKSPSKRRRRKTSLRRPSE